MYEDRCSPIGSVHLCLANASLGCAQRIVEAKSMHVGTHIAAESCHSHHTICKLIVGVDATAASYHLISTENFQYVVVRQRTSKANMVVSRLTLKISDTCVMSYSSGESEKVLRCATVLPYSSHPLQRITSRLPRCFTPRSPMTTAIILLSTASPHV